MGQGRAAPRGANSQAPSAHGASRKPPAHCSFGSLAGEPSEVHYYTQGPLPRAGPGLGVYVRTLAMLKGLRPGDPNATRLASSSPSRV